MSLIETLPTIYGVEKNGKTKSWNAQIYKNPDETAYAIIEYGLLDGKKQTARRDYIEGKNIGRKNETTPLQQCIQETKRKWQDKQEKENYSLMKDNEVSLPKTTSKYFPMLAHKYEPNTQKKKKSDIQFPCFVQPKLDGLRCIVYLLDGEIMFQSRTGSYFETMEHMSKQLVPLFQKSPGLVLDGELYTMALPFEELAGLIKKKKLDEKDKARLLYVEYHIYDIINDKPYVERYTQLAHLLKGLGPNIYMVPTVPCHGLEDFKNHFAEWVANGFEGIMLRNTHGKYLVNHRSHDLQKYKEFLEDEYPIIGFKEGDGRDKGTVIWLCRTPEGREFNVRPKGSIELRRELFHSGGKYIGKKLAVIYQELSELGVPRFPVGKAIRDGY